MKKFSTMVYFERGDEILFLVRKKENDKIHTQGAYVSIGGKIEPGESIEQCAVREVREESGLEITPDDLELRAVLHYNCADESGDDWVNFLFICSKQVSTPAPGNEGSFEWVKKSSFDAVNLYPRDKIFFDYLFKSQFFVLEFTYKGKVTLGHKLLRLIPNQSSA